MPALPIPELPPPHTPGSHRPVPGVRPARERRRERTDAPVLTTVRLCPADPTANADEIVTAAVSMLTTTYTAPGDRIMLADPEVAEMGASRTRRDRLVATVLRLGRGATTGPDRQPPDGHESATPGGGRPGAPEPGSGSGLQSRDPAETVTNPTDRQSLGEPSGPGSNSVELIIAGWSDPPADPFAMADWTPVLAPTGTVVVLTHSNDQHRAQVAISGQLSRAAVLVGLILTDRLILAHEAPAPPRPTTRHGRRAITVGGHRRIHTTAWLFRRSTPPAEIRHA